MIERKDIFSIPFYKKTHFSGSYLGMRYRIERIERSIDQNPGQTDAGPEKETILKATVFPGPYCFDFVPEEEKLSAEFEFSETGLNRVCDWLNEQYTNQKEKWKNAHL